MKFRPLSGVSVALSIALASCYPLETPRIQQGPGNEPALTEEQTQSKLEEELRLKAAEEELRRQQATVDTGDHPGTQTPPAQQTTSDYPFAVKIPGKEGFVFSPYNNKVIDVRDIPTGTLVQDPTYPASEKKYFRVP